MIGRIGHHLFTHRSTDWKEYADRLAALDWRKTAEIWKGNIIAGSKVMTRQGPLHRAFDAIMVAIGLDRESVPEQTVEMFSAQ